MPTEVEVLVPGSIDNPLEEEMSTGVEVLVPGYINNPLVRDVYRGGGSSILVHR